MDALPDLPESEGLARDLMAATSQADALAVLGRAALSGYHPAALVRLLDYARVIPAPILDRVRAEFVTDEADPYGRL